MTRTQKSALLPALAVSLALLLSLSAAGCLGRNASPGDQARRAAPRNRFEPDRGGNAEAAGRDRSRDGGAGFSPAPPFSPAEYDSRGFAHAQPPIPGIPGREYRAGFSEPNNVPPPAPYPPMDEGERVIYDPRVDGMPPPDSLISFPGPQSPNPAARRGATVSMPSSFPPSSKPFAGASVGRSNPASLRSVQAKQAMRTMEREEPAMRGGGNADQAAGRFSAVPEPAQRRSQPSAALGFDEDMRLDQEVRAKDAAAEARRFSAMAAPSGAGLRPPPRTEVSIPLNPEPPPAKQIAPARIAEPAARESIRQDEVFTPDLFLSGD